MASRSFRSATLALLALGLVALIPACGEENVPTPTTPAPAPPAPAPPPAPEPPAAPGGLRISATGPDFIEWSWTPVSGATGYEVQYSANEAFDDEDETIPRTAEEISYRRTGLEPGTRAYLRVRAAVGTGDERLTGAWSTHVTGMAEAAPTPEPAPEPPDPPTGLEISDSGADFIEWSWDPVAGVSGYDVQFSTNEGFTDEPETIPRTAEQTSYRRERLDPETSYYLRVRAAAGTGDGRVTGDWSTHLTGTTMAARPPAPTGLEVTGQLNTTITIRWDAVTGATRYEAQISESATFAGATPVLLPPTTTMYTFPGLDPRTTYQVRVRAHSGTISEPVFGYWSRTVEATTELPPAPTVTPLARPTGLDADDETRTSITLTWVDDANDEDDVDRYEVRQRPEDGSWGAANCGTGGDEFVTTARCVATELEPGTDYEFGVQAHPDPDDDTKSVSGWSSNFSAATTGQQQQEEITGLHDDLSITWESDDASITWTWSRPEDGRIRFLIALVRPADDMRPACPPLTVLADSSTFADPGAPLGEAPGTDTGWFGAGTEGTGDGLAQYSIKVDITGDSTDGEVRRLCVVPTAKDANGTRQYGTVSSAWAATPPMKPDLEDDRRLDGSAENTIAEGPKEDSSGTKTTSIDWFVQKDQGFTYEVRTVSAGVDGDEPTCMDDRSGSTNLTSTRDNQHERFRLSPRSLPAYTRYKACVRAVNGQGDSGWTELDEYRTLPSAPGSASGSGRLSASKSGIQEGTSAVTGTLAWSFGRSSTTPEAPAGYRVVLYHNYVAPSDGAQLTKLNSTCGTAGNGQTDTGISVSETGSGFSFEWTLPGSGFGRQATAGGVDYSVTVLACVQANVDRAGTGVPGPWRFASTSVSVPKQTQ